MKNVNIPQELVQKTHEVLDELEESVLGEKVEARRLGKTGLRAGARPMYGLPPDP
jgi:hypothetical protein